MNGRWWLVVGLISVLGALALPVLAQPGMGPGGWNRIQPGTGQPLSMAQAEAVALRVVGESGIPGLAPAHIMEFSNNFYVAVKDKATGQGAFELLINRYTGFVRPEPQSMMWNTKYGHMGGWGDPGYGMMGRGYDPGQGGPSYGGPGMMRPGYGPYGGPSVPGQYGTSPMSLVQARATAQQFLDARFPGTKTDEAIAFPGYYTIDVGGKGHPLGMLSVNAYTGQIWYHGWHGTFIREKDLD
jgi:hypothetical protein